MSTNTETPTPETQVVIVEELEIQLRDAFIDNGLQPVIDKIREEALSHVPDTSTLKGRQEIASVANKVAKSKTGLVALRKDLVADMKARCKVIDKEGSRMEEELNKIKAEVRKPLTEWEEAEQKRLDHIADEIRMFETECSTVSCHDLNSEQLQEVLKKMNDWIVMIDDAGPIEEIKVAKDKCIERLEILIGIAKKSEADAIELEKLRKEKEQRDAKDAEAEEKKAEEDRLAQEKADKEQERIDEIRNRISILEDIRHDYYGDLPSSGFLDRIKSLDEIYEPGTYAELEDEAKKTKDESASSLEVELKAALKREAEAKDEQDRVDEEARQATIEEAKQEERDAIQKENEEAEAAKQKRQADATHRIKYNANAAAAFEALDIPAAKAGELVEAIASNMIPNVTINY